MQEEQLTPIEVVKADILVALSEGTHDIVFEKKDGTLRTLKGTREVGSIPEEHRPKTDKVNKGNSIPVFDTEINEWRAFSLPNLISIDGNEYRQILAEATEAPKQ